MKIAVAVPFLLCFAAALPFASAGACTPDRVINDVAEGEGEGSVGEGEGEGEGQAGEGEGEGQGGEGEGEGAQQQCTVDGDCAGQQLCQGTPCTCQQGFCLPTCTSNADCTTPPLTACDTTNGQCTFGDCNNGGVTCDVTQTCVTDGRCITGSGNPCSVDDECPAEEFCSLALGQTAGFCASGCRTDGDCPGQFCSAGHTCVDSVAAFGEACADAQGNPDDTLCGAGLFCGILSKTCQEKCTGGPVACSGGNCCVASGLGCCNQFGFCSAQGC